MSDPSQESTLGEPGPDVPDHILKTWADQLSEDFADIFNLSLGKTEIPISFNRTTIILLAQD